MNFDDAHKDVELRHLLEVPVSNRSVEIGHFLAKHYGNDPTLRQISDLLVTEPKKETNSLHLKGVSSLDVWRDVMVGSHILAEGMNLKEAIRVQVDYENRDDPLGKVSEKSVRGSITRVQKAQKAAAQK